MGTTYTNTYVTKKGKKILVRITTNTPSPQALANFTRTFVEMYEKDYAGA